MKSLQRDQDSVSIAVTDSFYKEFMAAQSSFIKANNDSKKIRNDYEIGDEEKGQIAVRLKEARKNYNKYLDIVKPLEEQAKEQPLLQKTKAKYGDAFIDGKFTKAFKKRNNRAIGFYGAFSLITTMAAAAVVTAALTITTLARGKLLAIGIMFSGVTTLALMGRHNSLKNKKKYYKLEYKILEEKNENRLRDKNEQIEELSKQNLEFAKLLYYSEPIRNKTSIRSKRLTKGTRRKKLIRNQVRSVIV